VIPDENLSIERKTAEIPSKILHFDLSLDAMGSNHPANGKEFFLTNHHLKKPTSQKV